MDNYIHRIGKEKAHYFHWYHAEKELGAAVVPPGELPMFLKQQAV